MSIPIIFRTNSKNFKQAQFSINIFLSHKLSSKVDEKIEIPRRIPRGPTDILRALESTVGRDPTAAHYKYHDDPYLIPMSNIGKRTFAMAQEAGRKAAHWIRQEHADLFQHKESDPLIEAFIPKVVYNENSIVTEQDLQNVIQGGQVSDAILVYRLLKDKGSAVSRNTLQALLELLCYYNGEDVLSEEFIEERWFKQRSTGKERQRKTWKDGGSAEEIFISIESPTAETYAAIIQGMVKHYQVERAWELFSEAQKKGLALNSNTHNAIISVSNFIKEDYSMRWSLILDLLTQMRNTELKPNLGTLNSILQALSTMGGTNVAKENVLKVLREFKDIGIEPSLASWYFVLITYCKERGPKSTVLNDILREIENKDHEIRDLRDTFFFVTAMHICRNHLNDMDLAKRVHKLLHQGNNYNLIGDSYRESIYYRHYFLLLCSCLPLDTFMKEVYTMYVPHIYVPEPSVMEEILNEVNINGAIEYIPKLWSDMTIFDHTKREKILDLAFNIMLNNLDVAEDNLKERFSSIAWSVFEKIETQNENRYNNITITGDILGKIMTLVLSNNDFQKACLIMDKLDKYLNQIVGVPRVEDLSLYVDHCIDNKAPSRAIACIQYCCDNGFPEVNSLAAKINEKLTLDEKHLASLTKIVGEIGLGAKSN